LPTWDPDVYARYKGYRDRPALDLLVQIPSDLRPKQIWDLGCGPGEHAALLAARHPAALVRGLDSSPDMLAVARRRPEPVEWVLGDIADFAPQTPPDLIFTNSALQWAPNHQALFTRLADTLNLGGVLACQMSLSFDQPWHVALRETAANGPWRGELDGLRGVRLVEPAEAYFDWLSPICGEVDIWTTTYLHVLEGVDAVVEWMSGSGLRPYLDALPDPVARAAFLDAYRGRLGRALPARADGLTLFPFPRLFIVARR